VVLGITAGVPAGRRLEVRATADHGLTPDAPPFEVRLGLVVSFDGPGFGRGR